VSQGTKPAVFDACLAYSSALQMDTTYSSESTGCSCYTFVPNLTYLATGVDFFQGKVITFLKEAKHNICLQNIFQLVGWGET
jgi:hypothetical protein